MAGGDTHSTVHLGGAIRRIRKSQGLSIDAAAAKAGLSRNTLSNIERDPLPNPTLSTLLALMDVFGLQSIETLFDRTPSQDLLQEWIARGRPGIR